MDDSVIVVMLCARSKQPDAGHLRRGDGRKVMFVARPHPAPADDGRVYARPDDAADSGISWRKELLRYNQRHQATGDNPLGLLPAWNLYRNPIYRQLWEKYGPDNLYILSAGWGLIRADFLTPAYDITFSSGARGATAHQRRGKRDTYDDWRMLPADTDKPVAFFGGLEYARFFVELTGGMRPELRYVFYNARAAPSVPGCRVIKYDTRQKSNWHYAAARDFMDGRIGLYGGGSNALDG